MCPPPPPPQPPQASDTQQQLLGLADQGAVHLEQGHKLHRDLHQLVPAGRRLQRQRPLLSVRGPLDGAGGAPELLRRHAALARGARGEGLRKEADRPHGVGGARGGRGRGPGGGARGPGVAVLVLDVVLQVHALVQPLQRLRQRDERRDEAALGQRHQVVEAVPDPRDVRGVGPLRRPRRCDVRSLREGLEGGLAEEGVLVLFDQGLADELTALFPLFEVHEVVHVERAAPPPDLPVPAALAALLHHRRLHGDAALEQLGVQFQGLHQVRVPRRGLAVHDLLLPLGQAVGVGLAGALLLGPTAALRRALAGGDLGEPAGLVELLGHCA
mmetsp:Transcript_90046/g.150520  ORF Transcript_90046/g.150520 Transcript_90046/m.150520 type:complete len:328 (+) Transcript_90046:1-984(+)